MRLIIAVNSRAEFEKPGGQRTKLICSPPAPAQGQLESAFRGIGCRGDQVGARECGRVARLPGCARSPRPSAAPRRWRDFAPRRRRPPPRLPRSARVASASRIDGFIGQAAADVSAVPPRGLAMRRARLCRKRRLSPIGSLRNNATARSQQRTASDWPSAAPFRRSARPQLLHAAPKSAIHSISLPDRHFGEDGDGMVVGNGLPA